MNANDYPRGDETRLEYLEKKVTSDEVPQSPPEPEPTVKSESIEDALNARIEAIRRRPA